MIEHLSIQGRPVMEIITETKPGPNQGVQYAISYEEHSKIQSSLDHYKLEQKNFTLDKILDSYFCHYGLKKATEILLEKKIIAYESNSIIL